MESVTVPAPGGLVYPIHKVSVAQTGIDLHVCAVTSTRDPGRVGPGRLLYGVRSNTQDIGGGPDLRMWKGQWKDLLAETGQNEHIVEVACAGVLNPTTNVEDLHLCVVTNDGRLLHSIRDSATSTWTQFGDAGVQVGRASGFTNGGLTGGGWRFYILAMGLFHGKRGLGYTIRASEPVVWPQSPGGASSIMKPWAMLLDETGGGVAERARASTRRSAALPQQQGRTPLRSGNPTAAYAATTCLAELPLVRVFPLGTEKAGTSALL